MQFLENNLEDILYNTDPDSIHSRGLEEFNPYQHIFRQVNLGRYGIADIITVLIYPNKDVVRKRIITITIYELKKDRVDENTFWQAIGYKRGVEEYLLQYNIRNCSININIILIGKQIQSDNNFCFLFGITDSIKCYTYEYSWDGIIFNEESDYAHCQNTFSKSLDSITKRIISEENTL